MAGKNQSALDSAKLLQNALDSICLGVEDYKLSIESADRSIRVVSAARNLFAGVLLLFKYKIAVMAGSPENAAKLIYKTKGFEARIRQDGALDVVLQQESRTVDVKDIRKLFKDLNVVTDWGVLNELQRCRNDLEHLHAQHPIEEIKRFLVALFPLLRDFITTEIRENPYELLGATWDVMLQNHDFYSKSLADSRSRWSALGVLDHTMELFQTCLCRACGSALLEPYREDAASSLRFDDSEFRCSCMACGQTDSFTEVLAEELRYLKENPFDEAEVIIECEHCWHPTFDLSEGICHLCTYECHPAKCSECDSFLDQDQSKYGSLCNGCEEAVHQMREYELAVRASGNTDGDEV